MRYIVELEPGVWIAPWTGDPGRTLVEKNARKYSRRQDAKGALTQARKFRPFPHARIVEVDDDCPHTFPDGQPGETVLCSKCGTPWEVEDE
jgi:hypothetical protein